MKIFGMNFGKQYNPIVQDVKDSNGKSMAFSTPFLNVGSGNLSLPQVNKYYTLNNIVMFGSDNLYPQLLNQMYYTSAIHGACIDFISNATIGGGYSWTVDKLAAQEKVDLLTFEKRFKLKKLTKLLTRDYVIHKRVCVSITRNEQGKVITMKRLDPSTIRNYVDMKCFIFSSDWSRGNIENKVYKRYVPGCKETETLYVYQDETPGQDVYPIPGYNSILNWANLDGDIAYFHKSNIQNAVFPSAVIRRPKEFGSIDEVTQFKEEISSKTGAGNGGRLLVLTGSGFDDVPEFTPVSTNSNDKLFEGTNKDLKDNIAIAHNINPSIMGIKVSGTLGNAQELEMSYAIFEKNVIMSLRETMEEIFNDLIDIAKIPNSVTINDYQIIEKTITGDATMSKETGAENTKTLNPKDEASVNDALKGLTAAENMDMMRIIRDHGKGKLPDALAITRLKSYGMTENEAKEILGLI